MSYLKVTKHVLTEVSAQWPLECKERADENDTAKIKESFCFAWSVVANRTYGHWIGQSCSHWLYYGTSPLMSMFARTIPNKNRTTVHWGNYPRGLSACLRDVAGIECVPLFWVCFFGMILIRINDPRSPGSWYIKWTAQSFPWVEFLVPLMCDSMIRVISGYWSSDPDHPNQTHPLMLLLWDVLNRIILIILLWFRIILSRTARWGRPLQKC